MEPRREEPQKALEPSAEQKPKRFRIVKLEDRIAPSKGGNTNDTCYMCHLTHNCTFNKCYPTQIGTTCY